ncbi:MAG: hypothetical protein V4436_01920 [Patescibacteria group bacterium]
MDVAKSMIERIVKLETVGVGCGPSCPCRGLLAVSLTDDQAALIDTEAKAVVFDKKQPIGEEGVITLLGSSATEDQTRHLRKIARDKLEPDRKPNETGGVEGAGEDLMILAMHGALPMNVLLALTMGGPDIADMDDEDIRAMAYDGKST